MDKIPKISITCTANIMWRFLQEVLGVEILPAPIKVNFKKLYQTGEERYRQAEFAVYTQQIQRSNGSIIITPLDYSITVYVKSIQTILDTCFDNRLSVSTFEIYLKHILIHEMLHYLDYAIAYNEARRGNTAAMHQYLNSKHEYDKTKKDVEAKIELKAIDLLYGALLDLNTDYEDRPNLVPKIGGKYDRWRRKWDANYRMESLIFEYMYMEYIYQFGHNPDRVVWDYHQSVNKRLYDIQSALIDGREQGQFKIVK